MKLVCLVLLTLLGTASAPQSPAARVTFTPLNKAAYLAAQKSCVVTKPRVTFLLKKQHGRIVIPTAKGRKVFADVVITDVFIAKGHSEAEATTYTYQGYLPEFHCHLIHVSFYETEQWLFITDDGRQLELWGEPLLAPDQQRIVSTCMGLEYSPVPNNLQLLALQNGVLREVWHLEPKTWEPEEICWTSPTTLLLRKEMWTGKNPGTTYTYARLTLN